jgi:hypothetical protein
MNSFIANELKWNVESLLKTLKETTVNSQKTMTSALFLILSSVSFGQAIPQAYGRWTMPTIYSGGVAYDVHLKLQEGLVTETVTCTGLGQTATTQVSAAATITESTITTVQSTNSQIVGTLPCTATISAGTLSYAVSTDGRILTMSDDQSSVMLTREN